MTYNILQPVTENGIAIVTISRPQALNALNTAFFEEMNHLIASLAADNSIRAMILTGAGKAFVAGADIAEMVHKSAEEGSDFGRLGQRTFDALGNLPFPVIAAINGFALGGGLELAMACDFRIASSKAKFGQPEVNLGLITGYAGSQRLPRLVGLADALYLLTTAEIIGADDALRIGLVQKVCEPEMLMEETLRLSRQIAAKGPQAVRKIKMVTRQGLNSSFGEGSELEAVHFGSLFGPGSEGEEGMKAFLEKRTPQWN